MKKDNHDASPTGETGTAENYVLRLYVSGATPRSVAAIENIKDICDTHLQGRYDLQIIDIYQHPELAHRAEILAAPTLIKQLPLPLRKLLGDLSETQRVLIGLDVLPAPLTE